MKAGAGAPYEADIAFYVEAGSEAEIDVPIGVYEFYYSSGGTFYGTEHLFGENSTCFNGGNLNFYADSQYYNGHTITLYAVVNGNFDTDEIDESAFPTREEESET